ncbi:DUF1249 domain-containing protein [Aliidiomarina haloalkalitolerans]|uniref:DUF1249 domain-containing protein n=1 Tax=Aliidiomarina haloalkalitolerans TaxID=859059 RepID=UPI00130081BE|nr:DUF1249 domain-containing protein [Aliidiomarina haloalkalitolerans]
MSKRRYIPDLQALHSLAERNYAALQRLLGREPEKLERELLVGDQLRFRISEKSSARYTTDIAIEQLEPHGHAFVRAAFIVRLYHDARMAEIVDCQGVEGLTAIQTVHERPGQGRDEKLQLNLHLADWLKLCFQVGRTSTHFKFAG